MNGFIQEDKIYDLDIVKYDPRDESIKKFYVSGNIICNESVLTEYAWFKDSGKWFDCCMIPKDNTKIIIKNQYGLIFRCEYSGNNKMYFRTAITPQKYVWKYEY